MRSSHDLSVVMTTHNSYFDRGGSLNLFMWALQRQRVPDGTELIIVDDGSSDETNKQLREFSRNTVLEGFDVTVIQQSHTGNRAASRNRGVSETTGDLLLFIDDDTLPVNEECLNECLNRWTPGEFLCGARRYWSQPDWDPERIRRLLRSESDLCHDDRVHLPQESIDRRYGRRALQEYSSISGFGLVSREAFDAVEGFDEAFDHWGYEDADLTLRLLTDGVTFNNLYDTVEVLHLNHQLDVPSGASKTNRDTYHTKLQKMGVAFDRAALFDADQGRHDGIVSSLDDGRNTATSVDIRRPIPTDKKGFTRATHGAIAAESGQEGNRTTRSKDSPRVSIVISTANNFDDRRGSIELVLTALERQQYDNFEVIVVDDGSTDKTWDFLQQYAIDTLIDLKIKRFEGNTGNRALSRNHGAELATGEVLVFLDDDTIPMTDRALTEAVSQYERGTFLCGARRYWTSPEWNRSRLLARLKAGQYEETVANCWLPRGINRRHGGRSLWEFTHVTNFGVVPATEFHSIGGFDADRFDQWGREDIDLMLRLRIADCEFSCLYDHLSVVHLNHPLKPADSASRERAYKSYLQKQTELGWQLDLRRLYGVAPDTGRALQPVD